MPLRNHAASTPSMPAMSPTPSSMSSSSMSEPDSYARLLLHNQCYEAMPNSNKMVVFDLKLNLRKAFYGIIYQNTRHVLVSDAAAGGRMVGILSVTDFIRVMLRLHRERKRVEQEAIAANNGQFVLTIRPRGLSVYSAYGLFGTEVNASCEMIPSTGAGASTAGALDSAPGSRFDIGALSVAAYRELIASEGKELRLITINADQSLLEAARLLTEHRIHRLPVLDPIEGSPLFILTHKRLLKFLWCFGQQFAQADMHTQSARELGVGAWVGIRVVFPDTPLVDCLDILLNKGVSGLPVVERGTYKVVNMYSRFDAVGIALEERAGSLDVTVEQALEFKNLLKTPETNSVVSVLHTDSLWKAITVLFEKNVHRLVAVNENGCIEGVISLSDVINYLVVKPGEQLQPQAPRQAQRHKTHVGDLKDSELRALLQTSAKRLEMEASGELGDMRTYS